jgi:hypothetical protein
MITMILCINKNLLRYSRGMLKLHQSSGIFGVGSINWQIALCLLGVYIICYFSMWKGIHTSGKVFISTLIITI